MALKIINSNYYIKVTIKGVYYIYESPQARSIEKKATSPIIINNKYKELISNLEADHEQRYYDPKVQQFYTELCLEHSRYLENYFSKITTEKYPLMQKYIKDVNKSIPKIIATGKYKVKGNTLEEVYNFVKKCKFFGETEDC